MSKECAIRKYSKHSRALRGQYWRTSYIINIGEKFKAADAFYDAMVMTKASQNMYERVKNVYYQCIKSHFKCKTLANYIMCVHILHLK